MSAGERLPVRRVLLVPTRGRPQPPPPDLAPDLHAGTIANVIEYGPRAWAANLVGQAKGDLLQQRVITSFERRTDAPTKARGLTRVHPTPTPNPYSYPDPYPLPLILPLPLTLTLPLPLRLPLTKTLTLTLSTTLTLTQRL